MLITDPIRSRIEGGYAAYSLMPRDASPLTVSCAGRHGRSNSLIKAHQPDGVALAEQK